MRLRPYPQRNYWGRRLGLRLEPLRGSKPGIRYPAGSPIACPRGPKWGLKVLLPKLLVRQYPTNTQSFAVTLLTLECRAKDPRVSFGELGSTPEHMAFIGRRGMR